MPARSSMQEQEQSELSPADACQRCGLGCRILSLAASEQSAGITARPVHGAGLLKAVVWLFGAPLLLLLGAVWWLEHLQLSGQPLLSGLILAGIGWLVFVLARWRGNKLLNMVQPQHAARCGKAN